MCFHLSFERTSFADSFSVLILFWLCTFIASPTAVTQPHHFLFYILAIQHVIKIIFRSLESLVQIVSYFLYVLSLSPSLLEFICLTFNNIRIYVTTFGKHIKYERYLTHLWPERHVAHFMLFFSIQKTIVLFISKYRKIFICIERSSLRTVIFVYVESKI